MDTSVRLDGDGVDLRDGKHLWSSDIRKWILFGGISIARK
jgi:hypothetical protein